MTIVKLNLSGFWIINVSLWECPFVRYVPRPSQHIFSTKQEQKVNKHLPWLEPPVCPDGRPVFPTSKPFSSTNDDKSVVILINRVGPINFIHFIYEDRAVRNSLGATAPREQLKQTTNPNICGSVYKLRAIFRCYVTTGRPDWPAVTLCVLWLVENRGGLCGSRDCLPGLRMRISRPEVIILLIPPLFFIYTLTSISIPFNLTRMFWFSGFSTRNTVYWLTNFSQNLSNLLGN